MATVTINTVDYDGLTDVAAADLHLAADISRAVAWDLLTDDNKGRAIISSTRLLLTLAWCDTAPDPTAAQDSPIPEVTAELAADLAANPELFANATGDSNVKSVKAGSAQVEFFSPVDGGPPLPLALWNRLVAAELVCLDGVSDLDVTLDGAQPFGASDCVRPLTGRYPFDWPIASADYD